jgi:hypothetical protein
MQIRKKKQAEKDKLDICKFSHFTATKLSLPKNRKYKKNDI